MANSTPILTRFTSRLEVLPSKAERIRDLESGPDLEEITCRICHGYGDILDEHTQKAKTCPACRGTGTI